MFQHFTTCFPWIFLASFLEIAYDPRVPTKNRYLDQRRKVEPPQCSVGGIRIALRMTQEQVCEQVRAITDTSFTKGALSAIELGHRGASAATLAALEVVYGLPAGSLVVPYEPSHSRRKAS